MPSNTIGNVEGDGSNAEALADPRVRTDVRNDLITAGVFFALGAGMVVVALLAPAPGRRIDAVGPYGFPILVGTFIAIFAALVAGRSASILMGKSRHSPDEVIAGKTADESDEPASAHRVIVIMLLTLAYILLIEPLGYIISSMIYCVSALWMMEVRSWKLNFFASLIFTTATFALFGLFLGVPLPLGPLNELFVDIGLVDQIR